MHLHLVRSSEVDQARFTQMIDLLQSIPGPIHFYSKADAIIHICKHELLLQIIDNEDDWYEQKGAGLQSMIFSEGEAKPDFPTNRSVVLREHIFGKVDAYRKKNRIPNNEFVILITDVPNQSNCFASLDIKHPNNAFIHSGDWEYIIGCSSAFPVAYEVIALFLQKFLYQTDQNRRMCFHEKPIGCVSDLCLNKREIILKLRTADICSSCMRILKERLPLNVLRHARMLMEFLRVKMLFSQNIGRDQSLSRLIITPQKKLFLPDYSNLEIKLRPLEKALYFLFLDESNGIYLSNLCDHREKLYAIYARLSNRGMLNQMNKRIDNMTNILSNSASEKISRIRLVFEELIGKDLAAHYTIKGEVGDVKKISLNRKLIVFE